MCAIVVNCVIAMKTMNVKRKVRDLIYNMDQKWKDHMGIRNWNGIQKHYVDSRQC